MKLIPFVSKLNDFGYKHKIGYLHECSKEIIVII